MEQLGSIPLQWLQPPRETSDLEISRFPLEVRGTDPAAETRFPYTGLSYPCRGPENVRTGETALSDVPGSRATTIPAEHVHLTNDWFRHSTASLPGVS